MTRKYVVIGNGIAGQTAAEELRKADPSVIVMIAAERHPLYNRVALPHICAARSVARKVLMRTVEDYAKQNLGSFRDLATEIDVREKVVRTNRARNSPTTRCLIATGRATEPPPWPGSDEVSACLGFQTLTTPTRSIEKADALRTVLVMGGSSSATAREGVSFARKRSSPDHARAMVPALRAGRGGRPAVAGRWAKPRTCSHRFRTRSRS